ncbi:hypothetical protein HYT18_04590 [Candidatus Microgenomates bacterium]|nr:hypothetical protein [Candidatus Microgenomates bacterium]
MNKRFLFLIILLTMLLFPKNTEAKVLPQSVKAAPKQAVTKSAGTTITVSPRLRSDRKALIINFSNLQNAKSVSYMLVYKTAIQEEAAMGALNLAGATGDRSELLFGTCSKNVCRYHNNIKDARFEVSYTAKTGKKYLKKFKIKV